MYDIPSNREKLNEMKALLEWYAAAGIDAAVADGPTNWLTDNAELNEDLLHALKSPRQPVKPPPLPAAPKPVSPQKTAPLSQPSIQEAVLSAEGATSLKELQTALATFDGCPLKRTAKNLVFYRGSEQAPLMIIGEAPGRDEDIAGKPFVGRAGQLLDKMLAAIDITEENCHITNIVYWRPPGNRTPTDEEGQLCRPFLLRQMQLVDPAVILFVGGAAAKQLLETTTGIMKLRGKWKTFNTSEKQVPAMATLHPAYLLRTPLAKRLAWTDLLNVKAKLDELI